METVFDKIWREASAGNVDLHTKSRASISWLAKEVQKYQRLTPIELHKDNAKYSQYPLWGNMYMFRYFPKLHATLPYWDAFPLVFRIGNRGHGFLGCNFHYLSPARRLKLMRALMQDTHMTDEKKRMIFDYQILKAAGDMPYYKPTIKHYLAAQFRSQFIKIDRADWEIALYLPTARFMGAEKSTVWRKSNEIIRR